MRPSGSLDPNTHLYMHTDVQEHLIISAIGQPRLLHSTFPVTDDGYTVSAKAVSRHEASGGNEGVYTWLLRDAPNVHPIHIRMYHS